jgi:hypothetical protein
MPFYLWKTKTSTENNVIVFITDYKNVNKHGLVEIDNHGCLDLELIFTGNTKNECLQFAKNLMKKK